VQDLAKGRERDQSWHNSETALTQLADELGNLQREEEGETSLSYKVTSRGAQNNWIRERMLSISSTGLEFERSLSESGFPITRRSGEEWGGKPIGPRDSAGSTEKKGWW